MLVEKSVCVCDVCGHEWLKAGEGLPKRCAKSTCKSSQWNSGASNPIEHARKVTKEKVTGVVELAGKTVVMTPNKTITYEPKEDELADEDIDALTGVVNCPLGSGCKLLCDPPWFKCTGCGRYRDGRKVD